MNPFSLKNKRILITGATSDIGIATAKMAYTLGASIVALGRSKEKLEKLRTTIGDDIETMLVDLTDISLFENYSERIDVIDGIVHIAGSIDIRPAKWITIESMQKNMNINFYSPVFLTQYFLNKHLIRNSGSVVFLSSRASNYPGKIQLEYSAAKNSLSSAVKVFAQEYAHRKIRFNLVSPAIIKTQKTKELLKTHSAEQQKYDESLYPLGYGTPIDVAGPICFFLSDASKWITATGLAVAGGLPTSIP